MRPGEMNMRAKCKQIGLNRQGWILAIDYRCSNYSVFTRKVKIIVAIQPLAVSAQLSAKSVTPPDSVNPTGKTIAESIAKNFFHLAADR
ncbi:hypothetical protein A2V82_00860 [candidate division KSB1 bacterium RBG_16_48_16]|nr:MAG: hypothetical protein A2V82_00860 [candidate division KSB1 bacterium RBG_16_48_16]